MITIIIGIGFCITFIIYFARKFEMATGILLSIFTLIFTFFLIAAPLQGYNAPKLSKEIELLPLKEVDESENVCYIDKYMRKEEVLFLRYAYDNSKAYNLGGVAYEEKYVRWKYSKIYESKDCSKPILKIYVAKAKKGLFTYDLFKTREYEYVFYVPEGTVAK